MARAIKQFRYYKENDTARNQPVTGDPASDASYLTFCNGNVFKNANVYPILQLGVQTLPGTRMYLNGSSDPIIIGSTGIYEIDVSNEAEIVNIYFDSTSMLAIRDSDEGYLIVDVLYDKYDE